MEEFPFWKVKVLLVNASNAAEFKFLRKSVFILRKIVELICFLDFHGSDEVIFCKCCLQFLSYKAILCIYVHIHMSH